jgi:two-component system sensor histidine kinase KdpD
MRQYFRGKPINVLLAILKNAGVMVGILIAATLVSFGFRVLGFHESNFIMMYILGVLLIANFTTGYLYGILSSVLGVLIFNFFFTEPYYTLVAYSPEYPITFVIMLIVALITSTIAARAKRESRRAELREKRINILYQIERNLLAVKNIGQVADVAAKDISQLFGVSIIVCLADIHGELDICHIEGNDIFDSETERMARRETYESGIPCGAGTELFSDSRAYFMPISGQSGVLGVIGIGLRDGVQIIDNLKIFLETVGAQIAMALERERLYEKQQQTKTEMERERLRGNLLRAISHDLRTPLTGILGSASTVIENYYALTDDVKKEFLQGIFEDAEWLNNLVDNILSMTRFDDGTTQISREMEAVEEIISEAVSRVKNRAGKHEIKISIPDELIMIPADGTLIEQVVVNLLDNAIKHTPDGSGINVSVKPEKQRVVFEVSDNGPGIPGDDLPYVFNRFYKSEKTTDTVRRGIGLGLTICKSIIEAHGGVISVQNKPSGGAVFRFTLPIEEQMK